MSSSAADGAFEFAAGGRTAAGGDGGDVAALIEKLLELGKDRGGVGQVVETKFDEVIFADDALAFSSISAGVAPVMATQILPMRERM